MTRSCLSKRNHLVPDCNLAAGWAMVRVSSALCPGPASDRSDYQSFSGLVAGRLTCISNSLHPAPPAISSTKSLGTCPSANYSLFYPLSLIIFLKKTGSMQIKTINGLRLHNVLQFTSLFTCIISHIKPCHH